MAVAHPTVGRNDPCPCGSGRKYKQCCQLRPAAAPVAPAAPPQALLQGLLQQAAAHFQAQRWAEAEACCRQFLAALPDHADALHLQGMIAIQQGRFAGAVASIGRALQLLGGQAAQTTKAAQSTQAAPAVLGHMHFNLAVALQMLGRGDEAVAHYRQSVTLRPDQAPAWNNLAVLLRAAGRREEAIAALQGLLALQATNAALVHQIGVLWQELDRLPEAEACYRRVRELQADVLEPRRLGWVLLWQGKLDEAETELRADLAKFPQSIELLRDLATIALLQNRYAETAALCRQLLALRGDLVDARTNLGTALLHLGQPEAAIASYREALALDPDSAETWSALLFAMHYVASLDPAEVFAAHRDFGRRFGEPLKSTWRPHGNDRTADRRLRIGYVSADFYLHSVAFFIEPVLSHHDKARVEVFCYYNNTRHDSMSARLQTLADHWCVCAGLSDEALAERIRADGIDILVDLSGHSGKNRLLTFARQPAPVQATWIGYPGTTGLDAVGYRFTDALLDPPGLAEPYYTETLVRLPAWALFRPNVEAPSVNTLPALTSGQLTLGCLNNMAKINPGVIALWAQILHRLPDARLLLGNAGADEVRERLMAQFGDQGIGPERLTFLPRLPLADYLALYHRIDIALDPFPFTGGVTTGHALWMGVPVVTLAGRSTISRQGAAMLGCAGLPQCVASSEAGYVQAVLDLAADLPALDRLRQGLRPALTGREQDSASLTAALEAEYTRLWRDWCGAGPG